MTPVKTRYEYKYLIPLEILDDVQRNIEPFVTNDKFGGGRRDNIYTVRSIYFDTVTLEAYFEKIDGIRNRKKIRLRGYNESQNGGIVFAEIKRKYENIVIKNRAALEFENAEKFLNSGNIEKYILLEMGESHSRDASRFFYNVKLKSLRPVILIDYERSAFYGSLTPDLRITLDFNLRSRLMPKIKDLFSEKGLLPALNRFSILEIKFYDTVPRWVINTVNNFNLKRLSVSKYTICLDTHKQFMSMSKRINFTSGISIFN